MKFAIVTCFCHNSCCLTYMSSPRQAQQTVHQCTAGHAKFLTLIFHSVAMRLRCGGIALLIVFFNRQIFGKDMNESMMSPFLTHSVLASHIHTS